MDDETDKTSGAPKKTVEAWASAKGMLPQIFPGEDRSPAPGVAGDKLGSRMIPIGKLKGPRANPAYWRFAAAKAGAQWPENKEVTESEFDAAVALATVGHKMG
ncbi:MAG: hypothetical protein EPN98_21475 [Phenylobacterium sp.]|uniref:hypothetical protein n=1 Tax=Phenylobacterium sp. TaxID=1871053 RepID=UPI001210DA16|nr:hypothetical protein [Phenylobacterium sp.]TAL29016.1 MAG: hypothetical protein EPN98_21475 [Phenylobacterium sp.]